MKAEPVERAAIFQANRPLLFSIAYRMLGSASNAEDILQDAFLSWEQRSDETVDSPKSYLVTIVSRLCINHLKSARVRREQYFGQWLPEPLPTGAGDEPDRELLVGESLSYPFLLLLQRLNPFERAVFILRDVFDYDYPSISKIIGRSEDSCRQLLHRAHANVKHERKRFEPAKTEHDALLRRFVAAALDGEMGGLLAVLSRDVALYADGGGKATAVPNVVHGADKVARLMVGALKKFAPEHVSVGFGRFNGQPGVIAFEAGRPAYVLTIDVVDAVISNVYIVSNPDKLTHLPSEGASQFTP